MADGAPNLPVLVFAPFGKDASLIERVLAQSSVTDRSLSIGDATARLDLRDAGAAVVTEEVLAKRDY